MIHNREELLRRISAEADRARVKYPTNDFMTTALGEEVGEFCQAFIDHEFGNKTKGDIIMEGIQVGALAVRLMEEGSAEFKKFPGVYNMTEADFELTPKPAFPTMTPEVKKEIEGKWLEVANVLNLKKGTPAFVRGEQMYFQGAMQTIQALLPNYENPKALSKDVPVHWAMSVMSGRSITQ
jgi:hypothetical protein